MKTALVEAARMAGAARAGASDRPRQLIVSATYKTDNVVDRAFDKAARCLGCLGLKLGRVGALFVTLVEEANRAYDGSTEYLTGVTRIRILTLISIAEMQDFRYLRS